MKHTDKLKSRNSFIPEFSNYDKSYDLEQFYQRIDYTEDDIAKLEQKAQKNDDLYIVNSLRKLLLKLKRIEESLISAEYADYQLRSVSFRKIDQGLKRIEKKVEQINETLYDSKLKSTVFYQSA